LSIGCKAERGQGPRLPFAAQVATAALRNVAWAGRWQRLTLNDGRTLIIDGSHNEEGIRAIEPLLAALPQPTIVVGALGLDRAQPLVAAAARHAARLVLVRPDNERACTVAELADLVPTDFRGEVARGSTAELFPSAGTCTTAGDPIVVLGSLYLVGEVLARHQGLGASTAAWQDRLPPKP
jgi:folylpolyglutamate synthase/dihydropteroate synthase